jgi:UDPglucose--hexose-1-phosphate uridylyltransferase
MARYSSWTVAKLAHPLFGQPHRRYNPLADEWVLVSTERLQRPWQGQRDRRPPQAPPVHDPSCYLCPGNKRASGAVNPQYVDTFVFTNDFAALRPDTAAGTFEAGLLCAEGEQGTCRVLCFSPRHDVTMAGMGRAELRRIVDTWASQTAELGQRYRWVQVFENRGEAMGASSPHPHGQIWAGTALPQYAAREDGTQRRWRGEKGTRLLLDYAAQEHARPRVVEENDEWLVVVPFWATWPYETLIVPRRPTDRLDSLDEAGRDALVSTLSALLGRYDALFDLPFPYSMGWHQAPFDPEPQDHWQLHAHVYPPLLSGNMVRKFMVGYELLSEPQRDLSAEDAAARLREASATDKPMPSSDPSSSRHARRANEPCD